MAKLARRRGGQAARSHHGGILRRQPLSDIVRVRVQFRGRSLSTAIDNGEEPMPPYPYPHLWRWSVPAQRTQRRRQCAARSPRSTRQQGIRGDRVAGLRSGCGSSTVARGIAKACSIRCTAKTACQGPGSEGCIQQRRHGYEGASRVRSSSRQCRPKLLVLALREASTLFPNKCCQAATVDRRRPSMCTFKELDSAIHELALPSVIELKSLASRLALQECSCPPCQP